MYSMYTYRYQHGHGVANRHHVRFAVAAFAPVPGAEEAPSSKSAHFRTFCLHILHILYMYVIYIYTVYSYNYVYNVYIYIVHKHGSLARHPKVGFGKPNIRKMASHASLQ